MCEIGNEAVKQMNGENNTGKMILCSVQSLLSNTCVAQRHRLIIGIFEMR